MVQSSQLQKNCTEYFGMIGQSTPMRAIYAALPKIAATDSPLLIGGESGTGKDLIARAVHTMSARADGPFVSVNCAALPESLIQSELFGHEKGAFTGAHRRKGGKFQAADGGTILLDEIGDLSVDTQANLLHVLETRTVDMVGGDSVSMDVRVITATHVDLEDAVRRGRFREDLYNRLNVLSIVSPPLRDRGKDVQLLADCFFDRYTNESTRQRVVGFTPEARLAIDHWHWPGNVRELLNRVRKAIVMCEKGPLSCEDLGLERRACARKVMTLEEALDAAELRAVLTALEASANSVTVAAEKLGISRMTLYRLMTKHNVDNGLPELVTETGR